MYVVDLICYSDGRTGVSTGLREPDRRGEPQPTAEQLGRRHCARGARLLFEHLR